MRPNMARPVVLSHLCLSLFASACAVPEAVGDGGERRGALGYESGDRRPDPPTPGLGPEASLNGKPIFTITDDPMKMGFQWTMDVSQAAVDPSSTTLLVNGMGLSGPTALHNVPLHPNFGSSYQGQPIGIPYDIVPGTQQPVPITFFGAPDQSDPGPYPFPSNVPIEGGSSSTGDRHVLVIDRDHWKLYETYDTFPVRSSHGTITGWQAYSGAVFDLNTGAYRPTCWTSADAAGLPIFPGLIRYDEVFDSQGVAQGVITHAVRFTLAHTRHAFVTPATHYASSSTSSALPPMGMRVRLRASYPIDSRFTPEVQIMLQALKKYGMILADNGSNLYAGGTHDDRWNNDSLGTMKNVKASDFEVVLIDQAELTTNCP